MVFCLFSVHELVDFREVESMNKQYKIIWSKVKHCYVVVSELARNNGKAASTHIQSGRTLGVTLSVLALCAGLTVGASAATPYYSVNDFNGMLARLGNANGDASGGIGSTAAGLGTSVKTGAGSEFQGATATAVGMLNTIDASTGEEFDGVANAVVGAANTTQNANATLIFGAGNLVTNSYSAVMLNTGTINPTDPVGLSKALAGAVKESGGQILVVGGANIVDHARFSSITGVSNNLTGTTDKDSEYNFISGAKNTVAGSDHAYVIGTDNEVTSSTGNTLIGDNRILTGVTNSVILGSGLNSDTKLGVNNVSNVVVAGYKANATVADGVAIGSNSVASVAAGEKGASPTNTIVSDADKNNATWTSTLGAVSVGYAADGNTPAGTRQITNVAAGTQDTDAVNLAQLNKVANLINISNMDSGVEYVSINSDADGNKDNLGASANNSMAIGPNASTAAVDSLVIGSSTIKNTGKSSKVIGNGNTLSSTGAFTAEESKVFGDNNTITNSNRQLIFGDNNTLSGRDQGTTSSAKRTTVSDVVIGKGNSITGNDTYWTGIEALTVLGNNNRMTSPSDAIIIGDNQVVSSPRKTIIIGSMPVQKKGEEVENWGDNNLTVGYGALNRRGESIVLGNNSIASDYHTTITGIRSTTDEDTGLLSSIYGSYNTIKSGAEKTSFLSSIDGAVNNITGTFNKTEGANSALIYGSGNTVLHSEGKQSNTDNLMEYISFNMSALAQYYGQGLDNVPESEIPTYETGQSILKQYIESSGGNTSVIGSGNTIDYVNNSQILGSSNTVLGTKEENSIRNVIAGSMNNADSVTNSSIIGTGNTIKQASDNIIVGDYHVLSGGEHNLVLGSMATEEKEVVKKFETNDSRIPEIEYTVVENTPKKVHTENISNAVMLGYNTDVSINGGVALGSESIAATDSSVQGYNPSAIEDTTTDATIRVADASSDAALDTPTWTSTLGAVSVGYAAVDETTPAGTRQITNVAAGTQDTDAVNVAQLKAAKVTVTGGTNIASVESTATLDGGTVYTVNAEDTYVTSATLSDGTLTINQNEGRPITVTGLATTSDVHNSKVHYYSTKSDKEAAGSNFANDGAKANDSIVIGINSSNSQDAVNSIVLGNGTTLDGAKNGTNGKVNGSVVVANGATINGIYNSVLATDYNNSPSGVVTPTTVKGQHNVVIGAGNTVSGDQGVTIGTLNNVKAAYAIGQNNTVKSKGLAFGSNNTVGQTNEDGGIAIGRNLTVEGYEGVAIGGETQALADYSIAIGSGTSASEPSTVVEKAAEQGIALGYGAKAKVSGGIALGAGSQATTAAKVKGYDPSTDAQSTNTTGVWQSGKGALSIGTPNNTRQITGVAAGWQNTDAVNVAQLKASRVKVEAATGDANSVTVSPSTAVDGSTVYTINGVDNDTKVTGGTATYNQTTGAGTITVTNSSGNTTTPITIEGLQDTYVTGATLKDGTLTLTRNAGGNLTVSNIATKDDLAANKIEYFSVKSTETVNKNNAGATGTNAIAIGPKVTASGEGSVAIGFNNSMAGAGGVVIGRNTRTSGDSTVIIGDGAGVDPNIALDGHIAIGKNARVFAGGGEQEAKLGFDPTNWPKGGAGGYDNPTDRSRVATGIAMGVNAKGRTGSIDIGARTYNGLMGGKQVAGNNAIGSHVNQTALGTNTYAKGLFSTMLGSYSIATGSFDGSGRMNTAAYGAQNFGATVVGSLNSIRSNGSGGLFSPSYQGIANTITGVANITDNTNGSLVYGAGNKISNSITRIVAPTSGADSVDAMVDKLQSAIRSSDSGGATMAFGGGNVADYTQRTAIIGVNNTVTGSAEDVSEANAITGFENTATNVDNVTVTGSNNKITDTDNTILFGDNRTLTGANNSVVMGAASEETELNVTDATVIGYNANVTVKDGVALGSGSIANTAAGKLGYIPAGKDLTAAEKATATWTSKLAAVSVGAADNTRQITNVAAGTDDTDAVNVAQLKAVATAVSESANGAHTEITLNTKEVKPGTEVEDNNLTIAAKTQDGKTTYDIKLSDKVATTDDGLKFGGDTGTAFDVKLNNQVDVKGGITEPEKLSDNNIGVIADNGTLTVKLAKDLTGLTSINVGGTKGADGNYTGGITINNGGINMGDKQITNVGSGATGKDENGNPVYNNNTNVANIGDVITLVGQQVEAAKVTAGDNISVENNKVSLKEDITLGKDTTKQVVIKGSEGTITAGSGANQVAIDGKDASVKAGEGENQVALDGSNGQVIIGVDNGKPGDQIIMGNQEASPIKTDGTSLGKTENGQFITGLDNITWAPETNGYVPDRAATEGQLKDIADQISNIDTAVKDSSRVFAGDDGVKVTVKNGETLNLKGGADATNLSDGNIGVVANGQGLDIKLSKDLTGLNSVTTENLTVNKGANIGDVSIAGDTITVGKGDSQTIINDNSVTTGNITINNDGLTVKGSEGNTVVVNGDNVNMGGNVIHNIGDGIEPGDAVSRGQLNNVVNNFGNGMNQMSNRISKLDRRVDRVGAGAAALAALHPLEFSPEAKWEVSAGVGNYKSANAIAIGAFYRPNSDTMFSIGTSLGGGENMINAGVTLRVGDGETEEHPARRLMAEEIKTLKGVVAEQDAKLAAQDARLEEQNQKIEQLLQAVAALQK